MVALATMPSLATGQTDEIQVYNGGIAERGVFDLTFHTNFIPDGRTAPDVAGGVSADRSFNQSPESASSVRAGSRRACPMPLYNRDKNLGWGFNGFKRVRLWCSVRTRSSRKFFYGANSADSAWRNVWERWGKRLASPRRFDRSSDGVSTRWTSCSTRFSTPRMTAGNLAFAPWMALGVSRVLCVAVGLHVEAGVGVGLTA